jgi:1-pyrroline-5-carboxylate dehydrogenase
MSFRLTYATMFNPPEAMHQRFDEAMARVSAGLGQCHELFIDGEDCEAADYARRCSPIDSELVLGDFALATCRGCRHVHGRRQRRVPAWRALPVGRTRAPGAQGRRPMEERVTTSPPALTLEVGKNRMEALGEAQETVDFFHLYADDYEQHGRLRACVAERSARGHGLSATAA